MTAPPMPPRKLLLGIPASRSFAIRSTRALLRLAIPQCAPLGTNWLLRSMSTACRNLCGWVSLSGKCLTQQMLVLGGKLTEGVQDTLADRWRAVHMPQHWGDVLIRNPHFLFGCNNLFRKSVILGVGGYDEAMRTNGEDTDLCARLHAKGLLLVYDPSARATHFRHDSTRSILDAYWRWWRFGVDAYPGV